MRTPAKTKPARRRSKCVRGRPDARSVTGVDVALGRRLRAARQEAGLSQQGLARHLDITFQQVQKYEKGSNRIAASRLLDIARAVDKPTAYFLDGL